MISWERKRITNFNEKFAEGYATALVDLDGEPYDQSRFFQRLAETGVVADVAPQPTQAETDKLRFKRWDAYSNKIREFGFGFVEQRVGGPKIWRVSKIARAYAEDRLSYREFVALQMMRTQAPLPTFNGQFKSGPPVRPLATTLLAIEQIRAANACGYLAIDEFGQLQRVESASDLGTVVYDIIAVRSGQPRSSDWTDAPKTTDIWFNELSFTGYLRRLNIKTTQASGPVLVARWSRKAEARELEDVLPLLTYSDDIEVNAFHDAFCDLPSSSAIAALRRTPEFVVIDIPTDADWDAASLRLRGRFDIVGGLGLDDSVVLRGPGVGPAHAASIFTVAVVAEKTTSDDAEATLRVTARRLDHEPISI